MPAQDRIGSHDRGQFHQRFATECLPLNGQQPPLFIGQKDPLFTQLLEQRLNLGILKLNNLLLTLIHPRGESNKCQLPRLQNEIHEVTGCSIWKTS